MKVTISRDSFGKKICLRTISMREHEAFHVPRNADGTPARPINFEMPIIHDRWPHYARLITQEDQ